MEVQVKDKSFQTVAKRTLFGWIEERYDEAEATQGNHVIVCLHTEMNLNRTLQQSTLNLQANPVYSFGKEGYRTF